MSELRSVGIVADGFGISHQPTLDFLNKSRSNFSVIINEKEKLANPATMFTRSVFRNVNDDNVFNDPAFDARHFVHNLAFGLHPAVALHLGNEPGYSKTLIDKTCDGMETCLELNRTAYLFNFAVFHPSDQFYEDIINHERFNTLYHRGNFWICGHEYFSGTIAQGISDGAILRPLWFRLAQQFRVAFTEWGYAKGYDPHAGWKGRISEDEYISQLEIYVHNPDFKRHNFPLAIFSWHNWHDFGIMDSKAIQDAIVRLNIESDAEMHYLTHLTAKAWNYRMGRGTQFPKLGSIDITTTPVELLDLQGGWYKVNIPSKNVHNVYISQFGGEVGFKKA